MAALVMTPFGGQGGFVIQPKRSRLRSIKYLSKNAHTLCEFSRFCVTFTAVNFLINSLN
jgi:hypothetical protein